MGGKMSQDVAAAANPGRLPMHYPIFQTNDGTLHRSYDPNAPRYFFHSAPQKTADAKVAAAAEAKAEAEAKAGTGAAEGHYGPGGKSSGHARDGTVHGVARGVYTVRAGAGNKAMQGKVLYCMGEMTHSVRVQAKQARAQRERDDADEQAYLNQRERSAVGRRLAAENEDILGSGRTWESRQIGKRKSSLQDMGRLARSERVLGASMGGGGGEIRRSPAHSEDADDNGNRRPSRHANPADWLNHIPSHSERDVSEMPAGSVRRVRSMGSSGQIPNMAERRLSFGRLASTREVGDGGDGLETKAEGGEMVFPDAPTGNVDMPEHVQTDQTPNKDGGHRRKMKAF
jgi:hypothetical protein